MNVCLFELKHMLKSLVVWLVCAAGILLLLMNGFYPAMMESKAEVEAIFSNFPPQLMTAIGIDINTVFSYTGFYTFSFTYIGLLAAIMSVSISLQAFAREKRGKCTDFILTKPLRRGEAFFSKYLACLTIIILFNLFLAAVIVPDFIKNTAGFQMSGRFVLLILSPFLTQLVFLSMGVCYSVYAKRIRSVSGTATTFGIAAFLLSAVAEILEKDALNLIAPLKYFDPVYIFDMGAFDTKLVFAGVIVFAGCLLAAFTRYCRYDVPAV